MKKSILYLCLVVLTFMAASCGDQKNDVKQNLTGSEIEKVDNATLYKDATEKLYDLSTLMRKFEMEMSVENLKKVVDAYDNLEFEYDKESATAEDIKKYKELQFQIDSMKTTAKNEVDSKVKFIHKEIASEQDHLVSATEEFPFYLKKGEKLFINYTTQGKVIVKLYNADSHAVLKTYQYKTNVHDSLVIRNSAVYLLKITPVGNQYIDMSLEKSVQSLDDYMSKDPEIKVETIACTAKDFQARAEQGIKLVNVFEEPHKVTLRSQGKAILSGGSRTIVAMPVPAGSTDLLYNLRISTSQSSHSGDGEFCKDMSEAYKEIKILGKTVMEKKWTISNLLREMLSKSEPYREEEAYCNLYVFADANSAKKFADGTPVSDLKYDVTLSKQGTQSCNDRVPINKGVKTLYFGFENTRFRYSVYLWLESLATTPVTEYYKYVYTVEE